MKRVSSADSVVGNLTPTTIFFVFSPAAKDNAGTSNIFLSSITCKLTVVACESSLRPKVISNDFLFGVTVTLEGVLPSIKTWAPPTCFSAGTYSGASSLHE
ncbi:hypothetical protein SDC9_170241 [bioreactor metagenome]|uniref:Uncharacterized protein n=1 Tax=bioreactor metagenome TaxID=1076179 RepID=A0A645G9Q4_9ZZZZ